MASLRSVTFPIPLSSKTENGDVSRRLTSAIAALMPQRTGV